MADDVHAPTSTLHPPSSETGMYTFVYVNKHTLSSLGYEDGSFFGGS